MLNSCFVLLILVLFVGCGPPRPDRLTWNDPAAATAKAMETYDRNGDGLLSADELKLCPAFSDNLRRLDTNRDGNLSADEIRARFDKHAELARFIGLETTMQRRGRPAVGAAVTLTPEPFMGVDFPTYSGTVSEDGSCPLRSDNQNLFGVPVGFYTLKVVHVGKETVRGLEVAEDTTGSRLEIAL